MAVQAMESRAQRMSPSEEIGQALKDKQVDREAVGNLISILDGMSPNDVGAIDLSTLEAVISKLDIGIENIMDSAGGQQDPSRRADLESLAETAMRHSRELKGQREVIVEQNTEQLAAKQEKQDEIAENLDHITDVVKMTLEDMTENPSGSATQMFVKKRDQWHEMAKTAREAGLDMSGLFQALMSAEQIVTREQEAATRKIVDNQAEVQAPKVTKEVPVPSQQKLKRGLLSRLLRRE